MLKSLYIKNLALIEEIKISFDKGFNVFTGETGAGKSIIINAIGLLMGKKTDKNIVREGCDSCKVEVLFEVDLSNKVIYDLFADINLEPEDLVMLTRVFNVNGKSEYYINGEQCTMNLFKKMSNELIDIFGQHDNLQLLDQNNHIKFVDKFIGSKMDVLKTDLIDLISEYKSIKKEISMLCFDKVQRAREIDLLSYEIKQIEEANFVDGEEENLLDKRKLMQNNEKIYNTLTNVLSNFEGICDVISCLKGASVSLGSVAGISETLDSCRERIGAVRWEVEDIVELIKDNLKNTSFNNSELEKIEERLDLINDFKRKYGNNISLILDYLNNAKNRVEVLTNCEEKLYELENNKKEVLIKIYNQSEKIHSLREENSFVLKKMIEEQLCDLGMKNCSFVINIFFPKIDDDFEDSISVDGLDKVEFLFSANFGQSIKPLDKVMSGGELSRFSLAFKTIVNDANSKTLIFDEIDTGIGGNTGSAVGKKICNISTNNQVICITHLAQIASFADTHFKITKIETDKNTVTKIEKLLLNERELEVGRMIGSIENKNYACLHSKELIIEATRYKNLLSV